MQSAAFPVSVTPIGPVACGAFAWRSRGALRATVIVKATFDLVNEGRAQRSAGVADLEPYDVPYGNGPLSSIRIACDRVPLRLRADVTAVGHAHAPPGYRAPALSVRLGLLRDGTILDKTLHVVGNRSGAGTSPPLPFERMPLRYERAYGGSLVQKNPSGVGDEASPALLPNVIDPTDPKRPAGFGPIAAEWWERAHLLDAVDASSLDAPIMEIPDGLSMDYFQAAPADQQVPFLEGDEWLVLHGLHASHPRLRTQLPLLRGAARAYIAGVARPIDVALVADTLALDTDAVCFSIVWRGNLAIPGEDALGETCFAAGLTMPGVPIAWPDRAALAAIDAPATAPPGAQRSRRADDAAAPFLAGTLYLGDREQDAAAGAPASSPLIPISPWSSEPAPSSIPQQIAGMAPVVIGGEEEMPDPPPPRARMSTLPSAGGPDSAPRPPSTPDPPPPPPVPREGPRAPQSRPRGQGRPRAPEDVAESLRLAGVDAEDIAALMYALRPPPPPEDDPDGG